MEPDRVPKDAGDVDATLDAVLQNVKFRNAHARRLTDYSITDDEVILTYQPTAAGST